MVAEIFVLPADEHVAPVMLPPPLEDELLELVELELVELELVELELELEEPVFEYEQ
jgi:hypothetical protein